MLESLTREELQQLVGREVRDSSGESVGFVDLVFVDTDTGRPEWLGVSSGVWETGLRVLVPAQGAETVDGEVRVRWTRDVIESAPSYSEEDDRGLLADDPEGIHISADKERAAYDHYGIEASDAGRETPHLRAEEKPPSPSAGRAIGGGTARGGSPGGGAAAT